MMMSTVCTDLGTDLHTPYQRGHESDIAIATAFCVRLCYYFSIRYSDRAGPVCILPLSKILPWLEYEID